MKILFMCVANSARSQMAEALAKQIFGDAAIIRSAGSHPKTVNPFAVRALKEIDIDIADNRSKLVDDLSSDFVDDLDYVITLCAEEVCPILSSQKARKLHWPFLDPAGGSGTDSEQLERFRASRDEIRRKISEFFATNFERS